MKDLTQSAAYGGPGWSPRTTTLREELGSLWGQCGVSSEWSPLSAVLLHPPGQALAGATDPDSLQLLEAIDVGLARLQHDRMAQAYATAGVNLAYVEPKSKAPPNLIFIADLLFMTPEGAIVGRPASTVRAGEECFVARRLSELGIPILRTIRGSGTFEGADAAWIDASTVLVATGLRTNTDGSTQVTTTLREMGISVVPVILPHGAMHLMGLLRFAGPDLAIAWPGRVPRAAVEALRTRGYQVLFLPAESQAEWRVALNFVTLGPRRILMAAGQPICQAFFESHGIECLTVDIGELAKAAGGIACMTGVLERQGAAL